MVQYGGPVPIFPHIPPYSPIFPHIPPYSPIFPHIPPYSPIFPHISPYSSIFPHISPYSPIFPHISPYFPIFPHISPYFPIFPHISPYFPIFPHISPYFPIFPHISPYFPIFPHISPIWGNMHLLTTKLPSNYLLLVSLVKAQQTDTLLDEAVEACAELSHHIVIQTLLKDLEEDAPWRTATKLQTLLTTALHSSSPQTQQG